MQLLFILGLLATLVNCHPQQRVTYSNFQQRSQNIGVSNQFDPLKNAIAETLPYQVLEAYGDYKVVRFPASKWVCTKEYFENAEDPFMDWRKIFKGDGVAAMTQAPGLNDANLMFNRLFRYMIGVNAKSMQIPMTTPAVNKRTKISDEITKHELCFWAGSEWFAKSLPSPMDDETYIKHQEPFVMFVRRFTGFALSNADWDRHYSTLMKSLKGRSDIDLSGEYYSVAYGNSRANVDRHNEVWVPKLESETTAAADTTLDYSVINSNKDFEVREYKKSVWACATANEINPTVNPMNNWQAKFLNNPFQAMASPSFAAQPFNQLHKEVMRYMAGVNSEYLEMQERKPILVKHKKIAGEKNYMESQSVCVWMGPKYDDGEMTPPAPINGKVYIQEMPPHKVYTKVFDGFALSYNDFYQKYVMLKREVDKFEFTYDDNLWINGINDSWFNANKRTNEVHLMAV